MCIVFASISGISAIIQQLTNVSNWRSRLRERERERERGREGERERERERGREKLKNRYSRETCCTKRIINS